MRAETQLRLGVLVAAMAAAVAHTSLSPGLFVVNMTAQRQTILGLGFEIQSDSIGSGNNGLPASNSSVPWDLTPSERSRFYTEMLTGFRYCRLALGLYLRGTTADGKQIVERWPGQAAVLADMAKQSGIEVRPVVRPRVSWPTPPSSRPRTGLRC